MKSLAPHIFLAESEEIETSGAEQTKCVCSMPHVYLISIYLYMLDIVKRKRQKVNFFSWIAFVIQAWSAWPVSVSKGLSEGYVCIQSRKNTITTTTSSTTTTSTRRHHHKVTINKFVEQKLKFVGAHYRYFIQAIPKFWIQVSCNYACFSMYFKISNIGRLPCYVTETAKKDIHCRPASPQLHEDDRELTDLIW